MTRTEELLALAETCKRGWHTAEILSNIFDACEAKLIAAANPETIKQLVELVRLQHDALMQMRDYEVLPGEWDMAVEAYVKFERGE